VVPALLGAVANDPSREPDYVGRNRNDPRGRTVRTRSDVLLLVLVGLLCLASAPASRAASDRVDGGRPVPIAATAETAPVAHTGDAADDPAVWVDTNHPARSLILGNDKQGALEIYRLDGSLRQRVTTKTTFWGNVDVRQGVLLGGRTRDVVAAYNGGLRLLLVNRRTGIVRLANDGGPIAARGEGVCLYHSAKTGRLFAFVVQRSGPISQYRISDRDGNGLLSGRRVRVIPLSSEAEGCVADDRRGRLYVAQEDVAIWRFQAEPGASASGEVVDTVNEGGPLVSDVEGLTLAERPRGGGVLIASVQNTRDPAHAYFAVYGRAGNQFRGTFDVVDGRAADGCERTDGIEANLTALGRKWSRGIFVCQDHNNTAPGSKGSQDFKLVDLGAILDALS
jgi:myo-inositol-hexaphosphate 3-phosphohydrolase